MSKWSLVESKERKFLISLPIFLILISGFSILILTITYQPVHATTPAFSVRVTFGSCGGGSNCNLIGNFNPIPNIGEVLVLNMEIQPSNIIINNVIDNVGNTWFKVASESTIVAPLSVSGSMWYTVEKSTAVNPLLINVSLSGSATTSYYSIENSNVPLSLATLSGTSGFTHTSSLFGGVPALNTNLQTSVIQIKAQTNYAVLAFAVLNTSSNSGNPTFATGASPLVDIEQPGIISGNANFAISATSETSNGTSFNTFYLMRFQSTNGVTTTYGYAMIVALFSDVTISPPTCQSCGISGGGVTKDTTTTFTPSMPNETLLYTFDAPIGGALVQNITTEVASYINGGTGKGIDFIYICIYQLPSGVLSSHISISSTNQLQQTYCQLIHSVSTGQTNQYLHVYPNILVPPSTTFAITIMSRFSGLSLYGSTTTVQLLGDTADYTGTSGTPPQALSNFFNVTPPIFFGFTGSQTSIMTTQTATTTSSVCVAGATCTFTVATITQQVTQIQTSLIYRLQGSNGAVANIQDLTSFLPIWVLPLVMGALFGVIGLLFGGVVGLGMGVMLGIIPLWFAFLLGLGIVFILFKRVI